MIKLNAKEKCPFFKECPYNSNSLCQGADPLRETEFICDFVNKYGIFNEGRFRNKYDKTGKMEIILENEQ